MKTKEKEMTKSELTKKLKILDIKDRDKKKSIVCSLIGHSKVVKYCFGYVHCSRCGDLVADRLLGSYESAPESVIIGCDCPTCRKNYKNMSWQDKYLAPNPFPKNKGKKK